MAKADHIKSTLYELFGRRRPSQWVTCGGPRTNRIELPMGDPAFHRSQRRHPVRAHGGDIAMAEPEQAVAFDIPARCSRTRASSTASTHFCAGSGRRE